MKKTNIESNYINVPKILETCYNSLPIIDNISEIISPTYSVLNDLSKQLNGLYDSINTNNGISSFLSSVIKKQKELFLNPNYIGSLTKVIANQNSTIMKAMKMISEVHKELVDITMRKINSSSFFNELDKCIEETKNNPDSLANWYNYYTKLSEYFWIYPYDMKTEQLHHILETVSSEREFDKYMSHYFSKKKIKELLKIIKNEIPRRHRKMITQIEKAYDMKLYALANNSLINIIDDLLSFYLGNKGCPKRKGVFEPIVEKIKKDRIDIDDSILITFMINSFINKLYESTDFNNISFNTHKKTRRGTAAHGKFTSNERSDFIMLINTIYHLIIVQEVLKKYKGRIFRKDDSFFLPEGEEYKKLKQKVDKKIKRT